VEDSLIAKAVGGHAVSRQNKLIEHYPLSLHLYGQSNHPFIHPPTQRTADSVSLHYVIISATRQNRSLSLPTGLQMHDI